MEKLKDRFTEPAALEPEDERRLYGAYFRYFSAGEGRGVADQPSQHNSGFVTDLKTDIRWAVLANAKGPLAFYKQAPNEGVWRQVEQPRERVLAALGFAS